MRNGKKTEKVADGYMYNLNIVDNYIYCLEYNEDEERNDLIKIKTNGYWDTNHSWVDSGFTWTESGNSSYDTNLELSGMSSRVKGDLSLDQVKSNINPEQINGKWFWNAYPNDVWMYDGLHPHSDRSKRCLKIYSQAIAGFLKTIGDGVY